METFIKDNSLRGPNATKLSLLKTPISTIMKITTQSHVHIRIDMSFKSIKNLRTLPVALLAAFEHENKQQAIIINEISKNRSYWQRERSRAPSVYTRSLQGLD